jgi:hypothetical protein
MKFKNRLLFLREIHLFIYLLLFSVKPASRLNALSLQPA